MSNVDNPSQDEKKVLERQQKQATKAKTERPVYLKPKIADGKPLTIVMN